MCEYAESVYLAIVCSPEDMENILKNIFETIIKNGKKTRKKNKKTVFDIMGISCKKDNCHEHEDIA
jgi:hypothetical protein